MNIQQMTIGIAVCGAALIVFFGLMVKIVRRVSFTPFALAALGFLACAMTGGIFVNAVYADKWPVLYETRQTAKLQLHSFTDTNVASASLRGNFLRIYGDVNQSKVYEYWYMDHGGYRHGQLSEWEDIIVFEDTTPDQAYLLKFQSFSYCDPNWDKKELVGGMCPHFEGAYWDSEKYEFHVPPGTVYNDFSLGS